jgi:hypothetical protein
MKPVLDLARSLDIATNPDPSALFEAGNGGFTVWCTPRDHPQGWNGISMVSGAFAKPCEYVGNVLWKWDQDKIVGLHLETSAHALSDQRPHEYCNLKEVPAGSNRQSIFNRPDDIEWLKEKVIWLFETANMSLPPFVYEEAPKPAHYVLAHFEAADDQYVVIASPRTDPKTFCRPGYRLAVTLEIGNAVDFPTDVILRPDDEFFEEETEPDEGPLVEQYENASRVGDDSWLEAAYEDQVSGWGE